MGNIISESATEIKDFGVYDGAEKKWYNVKDCIRFNPDNTTKYLYVGYIEKGNTYVTFILLADNKENLEYLIKRRGAGHI